MDQASLSEVELRSLCSNKFFKRNIPSRRKLLRMDRLGLSPRKKSYARCAWFIFDVLNSTVKFCLKFDA